LVAVAEVEVDFVERELRGFADERKTQVRERQRLPVAELEATAVEVDVAMLVDGQPVDVEGRPVAASEKQSHRAGKRHREPGGAAAERDAVDVDFDLSGACEGTERAGVALELDGHLTVPVDIGRDVDDLVEERQEQLALEAELFE